MFFLGRWLDGKLGTSPWLMLTGALVGIGGGMVAFVKSVHDAEDLEKDDSSGK